MISESKVKENVRRITRKRNFELAKRTEGCLLATCFFRYVFKMKHSRDPVPAECPKTCYYHPDYVPVKTSASRSQRREDSHIIRKNRRIDRYPSRQTGVSVGCEDPSPF